MRLPTNDIPLIQIISKILTSGKLITEDKPYCYDYDLFPEKIRDEYAYICEHYKKYGKVPDSESFISQFEEFEIVDVKESDEYLTEQLELYILYYEWVRSGVNELGTKIATYPLEAIEAWDRVAERMHKVVDDKFSPDEPYETFSNLLRSSVKKDNEVKINTGFDDIDNDLGGLRKGNEVAVIVARTGVGKSWFLQKMALAAYTDTNLTGNVAIISPEMDPCDVAARMWILHKHRPYEDSDDGSYFDSGDKKLIIVTPTQISPVFTPETIKRFAKQNKIAALYIDGLTYIRTGRSRVDESDVTRLGDVARNLMQISDELKIPITGVIQANRDAAQELSKCPELATIRGCDEVAHVATIVYSLAVAENGKLKIKITKNRRGRTGDLYYYDWNVSEGKYSFEQRRSTDDSATVAEIIQKNSRNSYDISKQYSHRSREDAEKETQQSMEATRKRRGLFDGKDEFQ